jgi:hypothetical protein
MAMPTARGQFQTWRERQQARQDHELVQTDDETTEHPLQEEGQEDVTQPRNNRPVVETVSEDEENGDIENQLSDEPESPTETTPAVPTTTRERSGSRRTLSLADLEEERELSRRRTSACVLLACFVLFRLWIQAVATGDFGLLLLCLVGTSWTARFIRHTREREEELDRLISEYSENADDNGEIGRNDVRMLSFQAQLALAVMESQRQMMEGGYGNPDGASNTPGVSEEAMRHWDKFEYKEVPKGTSGYGAVHSDVEAAKDISENSEEEPHCSICLAEYEAGDKVVCLPCKHMYHEDCVASWCNNHIRCPLCNFDLESVTSDPMSASEA